MTMVAPFRNLCGYASCLYISIFKVVIYRLAGLYDFRFLVICLEISR